MLFSEPRGRFDSDGSMLVSMVVCSSRRAKVDIRRLDVDDIVGCSYVQCRGVSVDNISTFLTSSLDVSADTVCVSLGTVRDVFAGAVISGLVLSRDSLFSML